METVEAKRSKQVKERLIDLDRTKREALRAKIAAEGNLAREQNDLRTAEESRKTYVELLSDQRNDLATEGYLHSEIDRLDSEITSHKRLIEAHSAALAKDVGVLERVRVEWNELDREVEVRERAQRFEQGKERIAARYADAGDCLEKLRLLLGDQVMDEFAFSEEFAAEASRFLTEERERFFTRQNRQNNRLRDVWGWNGGQMQFLVKPMQKILQ